MGWTPLPRPVPIDLDELARQRKEAREAEQKLAQTEKHLAIARKKIEDDLRKTLLTYWTDGPHPRDCACNTCLLERTKAAVQANKLKIELLEQRLVRLTRPLDEPLPYPPPSWIPDDAPAKKKYAKPVPCPTHCNCAKCVNRDFERGHLRTEWVELKREVALVCRLWWAWFGGVWHSD